MNAIRGRDEKGPQRVALYLRQSLDSAGTGLAVSRQEQACRRWVEARDGMRVVTIYTDNDVSATKRRTRPGFSDMLTAARAGEFDLIVAYHLDRLTRTIRDLLPLLELATDTGVGTTTVEGDLDLTSDMGRMVAGILAVVANAEVERKAARQILANRQRAEMGTPYLAGPRPFGYKDDKVTHLRTEATALRRAYRALLAGSSVSAIARDLNAKGLVTVRGNPWQHQTLRRTMLNARYAGLREYRGQVIGDASWEGLIDEPTWRAAVAILTDTSRRTNLRPGGERTRLLTGIARCGVCDDGTTVVGASRGIGQPTYRCRTGKHLDRLAEPLEAALREAVLERLSRDDARDLLLDRETPDYDALHAEALTIANRVEEVRSEFVRDDALSPSWLRDTMAALEARRVEVESRMAHAPRAMLYGDVIDADDKAAAWDALPLTRKRAILDALFTVTINRGRVGGNSRSGPRPVDLHTIKVSERAG